MSLINVVMFDEIPLILSAELLENFVYTLSSALAINPDIAKLVSGASPSI